MSFESRLSKKGSVCDDGCSLGGKYEVWTLRVGLLREGSVCDDS